MKPSLPVILLFLFLMICLAAAYFLTGSLQRTEEAAKQQTVTNGQHETVNTQ